MWEMESQRVAFGDSLRQLGRERQDIVVLGADLSSSTRTFVFAEEFPERFFNCGIAEQNMMGVAAGLAAGGKIAIPSTFAVFATGRVYDQIRQSIAYPKLNVKIVATHAGITVGGDGASHQINEDIALMRAIPNMTVVVPVDAVETPKALRAAVEYDGPIYIRLCRINVPRVTTEEDPFEIGKCTMLREGADVTLIGTGLMVSRCLKAAETLEQEGISASVVNMSTIKPLDKAKVLELAKATGGIVTAEEHTVAVGMGSFIATMISENYPVPIRRVGIPDVFTASGESDELMVKYGLTEEAVAKMAREVVLERN